MLVLENSELTITEKDCIELAKNNDIVFIYKDLESRYQDLSQNTLRLGRGSKFREKKHLYEKNGFDLYEKSQWNFVERYLRHDQIALQQKIWHGIDLTYIDQKYAFVEVIKKAVVDLEQQLCGSIVYLKRVIEGTFNDSILEILNFNKSNQLEFYTAREPIELTLREKECLFYTLRGKSAKTIGLILNISYKTVEFHLDNIKIKFDCLTKAQLISKAIELGYLDKITLTLLHHSH